MAVHKVEIGDAPPLPQVCTAILSKRTLARNKMSTLMENGLGRLGQSPYAAPPVLVIDGYKETEHQSRASVLTTGH